MLSLHDQSRGPWILLHVVSGPWTSIVAALDKGRFNMAVCRRYSGTPGSNNEDSGIPGSNNEDNNSPGSNNEDSGTPGSNNEDSGCPASTEKEDQRAAGSPAALTQLALCLRFAPDLKGRELATRLCNPQ